MDNQNFDALELFMDGRFSEAAAGFTLPEFRCAALLNAGDRRELLAEAPSYEQRLYLAVARGWGNEWLIRKIASKGLGERSTGLGRYFESVNRRKGAVLPKRIADYLIVPGTAERENEACFVRDQIKIDKLISSWKHVEALEAINSARDLWGQHPTLMNDEVRIWRRQDRPRAYSLARDLHDAYPNYFQGLKAVLEAVIESIRKNSGFPTGDLGALVEISERGMQIDPNDALVVLAFTILRAAASGKTWPVLSAGGSVILRTTRSIFEERSMLREISGLHAALPERNVEV